MSIVSSFCWEHCKSQQKIETMLVQDFGETTEDYNGIFIVAYYKFLCDYNCDKIYRLVPSFLRKTECESTKFGINLRGLTQ